MTSINGLGENVDKDNEPIYMHRVESITQYAIPPSQDDVATWLQARVISLKKLISLGPPTELLTSSQNLQLGLYSLLTLSS